MGSRTGKLTIDLSMLDLAVPNGVSTTQVFPNGRGSSSEMLETLMK